jgi:hypothetical protein
MGDKHFDAGLENARRTIIEGWMRMVLATGGIERYDDLHIDQIDPAWRGRESWVDGSSEAIDLAKELKTSIAPEKTLAIMCALTNAAPKRSAKLKACLTCLLLGRHVAFFSYKAAGRENEHGDYLLRCKELDHISFDR